MHFVADCIGAATTLAHLPVTSDIVTGCIQAEATRRAGKLSAAATTFGAWAQGASVIAAGFAALLGLSQWRREIKGRRQLEVAEACALSLSDLTTALGAFRSPFIYGFEFKNTEPRSIKTNVMQTRKDRASTAFEQFSEKYNVARLHLSFGAKDDRREFYSILNDLEHWLSRILSYEERPGSRQDESLFEARRHFYANSAIDGSDQTGARIAAAEDRLMAVLNKAIRPPPVLEVLIKPQERARKWLPAALTRPRRRREQA